ncbi:MAG: hypothetical protein IGS03_05770 [Candidatus Sericytochromatia bacterium]|nr:hypothetical protein [Candidatus Sericytochromatia bacterium]
MAESTPPASEASPPPSAPVAPGPEIRQIESQLVSLNFVLKNTQTEVIKLQKTLARQQARNDEQDKRNEKLSQEISKLREQRDDEARFRARVWFYQVLMLLMLVILAAYVLMKPALETPPASPSAESITNSETVDE